MLIKGVDGLRSTFYNVARQKHVLVVVGCDVDAFCSSIILTKLFTSDDVSFSVTPVDGWESLEKVFQSHQDQECVIVLVNCGGNRNLEDLEIRDGTQVFVFDSRRPINHENIYNRENIFVVIDEDDSTTIPPEAEVVRQESDDESSEDEGETFQQRTERMERRELKREIKRKWERRRRDLLWNYYENTWHSSAVAVQMLELSASLNRSCSEFMWLAAIGLNSQWTDHLISTMAYTDVCLNRMRPYLYKFGPTNVQSADDILRIAFEKELPLAMYSQWSMLKAMSFNEYFACKTRNWTQKGEIEMKHLLANLGLTLSEARQKYEAMSSDRRKEVFETLEKEMSSDFASYTAHLGYSSRINAADLARALSLKIETPPRATPSERLDRASDLLRPFSSSHGDVQELNKACEAYKVCLEAVWTQVGAAVNQSEVLPIGPFYLFSSSRELENDFIESRHFLYLFSSFLLKAFACCGKNRGRKPLLVSFPLGGERKGWHLVSGVMPLDAVFDDNLLKCYLGRAFREVSKKNGMDQAVQFAFFDSNIILLRSNDRSRFFEHLEAVMEVS